MSYDVTIRFRRFFSRLQRPVDNFGEQALFYGETMRYVPNAITRYRKETVRLVAEMTLGAGALVMIGGTVGVAAFLTLASGGVIAVQGIRRWATSVSGVDRVPVGVFERPRCRAGDRGYRAGGHHRGRSHRAAGCHAGL